MENMYYNLNKLMSYNALYSFAMGERGAGKTFTGKEKMIKDYVKKGLQSCYIRRTVTELDKVKDVLFNDIQKEYPQYKITVKGYGGYINGELFCYFMALSSSAQYKSASYPDVGFMFFDEYVAPQGRRNPYLPNEMTLLLDLVETVFRLRDEKVYLCSNAVSYVNPFFDYFGIEPKGTERFIRDKTGEVVVELTKNSAYLETKKKTRRAKMLEGTEYYAYSIDNEVLEDNSEFLVDKKPQGFDYCRCAFRVGDKIVGLWSYGATDSGIWVGDMYDENATLKYTCYTNQNFSGWRNIKIDRTHWNTKYIRKCFLEGRVYYENQTNKKFFTDVVSKFII